MKSMKKLVLVGLVLLASVMILAGCKNDSVPEGPKYTVKFESEHGTAPASITVESGTKLTTEQLKALPDTEDNIFEGWYDGETQAKGGEYTVTKNVTLVARWRNRDTNAGDSPSNTNVTTQQSPTEDGSDDNNTSTVKPEVLEYTVTFNSNDGSEVATQTVKNGKTVSKPENPTKTGFLFDGWYSDSELKNLFDFATPITGNIALYAKWQEKVTIEVTNETFATGLAEVMQKSKSILILTEDISVAETMKITSGDFILDLNGHKIEGTAYPVLEIAEAVSLVIQDSGENGCITPTRTASGMPLGVRNKGSLTLTSGSIEVNGEDSVGIENQGDFRMIGGRIIVNESSPDFLIQVAGVNNNSGTLWVSGGTIAVTGSGGTRGGCDGIWGGTLYLSGNPSITGTSNISSTDKSDNSFILVKPITLVGKLSNTYTVKLSELEVGDAVVIGGEGYLLSENDVNNFELSNKNMELVLDKNKNALVLQETSTN